MLHFISWAAFVKTILVLSAGYYAVICLVFYRREISQVLRRR